MISKMSLKLNEILFYFDNVYLGYFSCFGETYFIDSKDFLTVEYKESVFYTNDYSFKALGSDEVVTIEYEFFNFLDGGTINPKYRDNNFSSFEEIYFICRNIVKENRNPLRVSNAAVVMAYRALDLGDQDSILYCTRLLDRLINEAVFFDRVEKEPKRNTAHTYISMCYVRSLLALFLSNEQDFFEYLMKAVKLPRELDNSNNFLAGSYFTLVLIHRILSFYIDKELHDLLYEESLYFAKKSFLLHDSGYCNIRLSEFSRSLAKLSGFKSFILNDEVDNRKYFFDSLRCGRQDELYRNFLGFSKGIFFTPFVINRKSVDNIRDSALLYEKKEDYIVAMKLMKLALINRPNGGFIRKKVEEYEGFVNQ